MNKQCLIIIFLFIVSMLCNWTQQRKNSHFSNCDSSHAEPMQNWTATISFRNKSISYYTEDMLIYKDEIVMLGWKYISSDCNYPLIFHLDRITGIFVKELMIDICGAYGGSSWIRGVATDTDIFYSFSSGPKNNYTSYIVDSNGKVLYKDIGRINTVAYLGEQLILIGLQYDYIGFEPGVLKAVNITSSNKIWEIVNYREVVIDHENTIYSFSADGKFILLLDPFKGTIVNKVELYVKGVHYMMVANRGPRNIYVHNSRISAYKRDINGSLWTTKTWSTYKYETVLDNQGEYIVVSYYANDELVFENTINGTITRSSKGGYNAILGVSLDNEVVVYNEKSGRINFVSIPSGKFVRFVLPSLKWYGAEPNCVLDANSIYCCSAKTCGRLIPIKY